MKYKTLEDLRAGNSEELMGFMNSSAIEAMKVMPEEIRQRWIKIVISEANENFDIANGEVSFDLLRAIVEWKPK